MSKQMTQFAEQTVQTNNKEDYKKKRCTIMLLPVIPSSLIMDDIIIGVFCNCRVSMQEKNACPYCWTFSDKKLTNSNRPTITITYAEFKNFVFSSDETVLYYKKNNEILMAIEKVYQDNKTCMYYNVILYKCKASLDNDGEPYKYALRYSTFNSVVCDIFIRRKKIIIQQKNKKENDNLLRKKILFNKDNKQQLMERDNSNNLIKHKNEYPNLLNNKFQ